METFPGQQSESPWPPPAPDEVIRRKEEAIRSDLELLKEYKKQRRKVVRSMLYRILLILWFTLTLILDLHAGEYFWAIMFVISICLFCSQLAKKNLERKLLNITISTVKFRIGMLRYAAGTITSLPTVRKGLRRHGNK